MRVNWGGSSSASSRRGVRKTRGFANAWKVVERMKNRRVRQADRVAEVGVSAFGKREGRKRLWEA